MQTKDKAPPLSAASWLYQQLGRVDQYHLQREVMLRLVERRDQHVIGEMYKKLAARQNIVVLRNQPGFREAMDVIYAELTASAMHEVA